MQTGIRLRENTEMDACFYQSSVPPQRYALKPPRQFQPQVIQRLGFELFGSALAEVEVERCANQRVLGAVCEAIAVPAARVSSKYCSIM